MEKIIITLDSITTATRARRTLSRQNITSRIIKLDADSQLRGCTYGLEISNSDFFAAIGILKMNEIEYSVYNAR